MSKLLNKTVGKWKIWSIVLGVVLLLGIVLGCALGYQKTATTGDMKTLTVRVESYTTADGEKEVRSIIDGALKKAGIKEKYVAEGNASGGKVREFIFVFAKKTSDQKLSVAEQAVQEKIDAAKANSESNLFDAFIYVAVNDSHSIRTVAKGFVWRAILGASLAIVASFVYVLFRYKWRVAVPFAVNSVLSLLSAMSLVVICRIPASQSVCGAYLVALVFSMICSLVSFAHIKEAEKAGETQGKTAKEIVCEFVPVKGILGFGAVLAGAILILACFLMRSYGAFLFGTLVSLIGVAFVSVIWLPSVYAVWKNFADKKFAKKNPFAYEGKQKKQNADEGVKGEN